MDSYDIALSLSSGYTIYGETALRDLATYDPVKYQEVQKLKKWIETGDTVNAIASGNRTSATTQVDNSTQTVNNSINTWVSQNSSPRSSGQVQDIITNKLA